MSRDPSKPDSSQGDQALIFAREFAASRTQGLRRRMASASGTPKKVLLADDDDNFRLLVSTMLSSEGFEIGEATNGEDAMKQIKAHAPDVVVLDVDMPGMSGLEVSRSVRHDPATKNTRIVMLSARDHPDERKAGIEAGADIYLTKPFSPSHLLAEIQRAMGIGVPRSGA